MVECSNCGYDGNCHLDRFCYNCKWDFQPGRKDLPNEFKERRWGTKRITKASFEDFIKSFNVKIEYRIQDNKYKTKQHLIDEWHKYCSIWAEVYDL